MTDRENTAEYIGSLARQLAIMAKQQRMGFLAYLIEMVELQAIIDATPEE